MTSTDEIYLKSISTSLPMTSKYCPLLCFLLLLLAVPFTNGLSIRKLSSMSQRKFPPLLDNPPANSLDIPFDPETSNAIQAMKKCARVTALSSIVDVGIYGAEMLRFHREGLLMCLRTLWKVSFAYNIWKVSRIYQRNLALRDPQTTAQGMPLVLRTMTRVWRITALVLALSASTNLFLAWQDKIPTPHLRAGNILTLVAMATACIYASNRETKGIVPVDSSNGRGGKDPDLLVKLGQQGVVMTRAMLLSCSALLLQASFHFLIAASKLSTSWQDAFLGLLNIPAPMALAQFLYTMRRRMIVALSELQQTSGTISMAPVTHRELSLAQQQFYAEVVSTFKADVIAKILFLLVSGRGMLEILAVVFANKVA